MNQRRPVRRTRAVAVLLLLLAIAAVTLTPAPAQAKVLCGQVTLYYWLGTVVGAQGYSTYACGCSLIQWGAITSQSQVVDNYCMS